MNDHPYISVAFANRNDGYGGDLERRIKTFIDYYAYYVEKWPGLFEFVVCDWNPPTERPKLSDSYEWDALRNVLHIEVPPEAHAEIAGAKGRKMLDYIGRNVALRHGSGEFSLVLNQDIFVSHTILEELARRRLSTDYFYRADRCDFDLDACRDVTVEGFEAAALSSVFCVHRRHRPDMDEISVEATQETLIERGSRAENGDRVDPTRGIILSDEFAAQLAKDRHRYKWFRAFERWTEKGKKWQEQYLSPDYHQRFFLHTNASGDFILAPRQAFFDVHGMPETTDFYMHLDTYALVQLFAAGYKQAVFAQPHRVFHADHDRSGRADFQESIIWAEHEVELSKILRRDRSFRINSADWGLKRYDLPTSRTEKALSFA